MATQPQVTTRAAEFFRHHDAKDMAYLRATLSEDAQGVDEISRGWMRGRPAMEAYLAENFPRISEMHSTVDGPATAVWGDVEVETFILRQSYVFDGTSYEIEAPTTLIWRREGDVWRVALFHSIPLPPAS